MKNIEVVITEEDLEKGIPWDSNNCPIVLSLKRSQPNSIINVTPEKISIIRENGDTDIYKNSKESLAFMDNFDGITEEKAEPCKFKIIYQTTLRKEIEEEVPLWGEDNE